MTYELHWSGGIRSAQSFSVLDTALNEAVKLTRPPARPPAPTNPVARLLGTRDTDPYGLLSAPAPRLTLSCRVVELDPAARTGGVRIRAFVDDGVITWAIACKHCAQAVAQKNHGNPWCSFCEGLRAVRDRT